MVLAKPLKFTEELLLPNITVCTLLYMNDCILCLDNISVVSRCCAYGDSSKLGHYVAYVKGKNGEWYGADDSQV